MTLLSSMTNFEFGIGLNLPTPHLETLPFSYEPMAPENLSDSLVVPSIFIKICLEGNSFRCKMQISHCNGTPRNISKYLMEPRE